MNYHKHSCGFNWYRGLCLRRQDGVYVKLNWVFEKLSVNNIPAGRENRMNKGGPIHM